MKHSGGIVMAEKDGKFGQDQTIDWMVRETMGIHDEPHPRRNTL